MTVVSINGFELKEETVLAIGKFTVLWNIFENERFGNHCTVEKLEKLNLGTSKEWQELAQVLNKRQKLWGVTQENYVGTKLRTKGLNSAKIEKIKTFLQSEGQQSIEGGLFILYRIRNNMFHGLKEWQMLDSQTELFNAVNKALERILRGNQ